MRVMQWLLQHSDLFSLLALAFVAAVVDANTWTAKMMSRVQAAGGDWEKGVANPRRSPTAAMKAAGGKWKTRMQQAITNDAWMKGIAGLTDQAIQAAAAAAGGSRFVAGVTSRQQKIADAIAKLQPKVAALSSKIQSLPQDTDQQREDRMIQNVRGMRAIGQS